MTALTFHFTVPSNPTPPALPDNSDWEPVDSTIDNRFKITFSDIPSDVESIDIRAGTESLPFQFLYTVTGVESYPFDVEFPHNVPEDDIKVWARYNNGNGSSISLTDTEDTNFATNGYQTVTVTNSGSTDYVPTYITLTSTSFNAAASSPVTVGTLAANGVPSPDFSIVSDPSGLFSVSTANLVATGSWTAGQSYPITVRATNTGGDPEGYFDQQFTIVAQDQTQQTYERDTLRLAMVAAHEVPRSVDSYNTFTGFTDLTGFSTVTVNSSTELFSALRTYAASTTAKVIIELAWNDASYNSNLSHILGPAAGSISANSQHPCGYSRPMGGHILVRPAAGYDPLVRSNGVLYFQGINVMEFRDVNFRGFRMYFNGGNFGSTGRPLMGALAMNRCGFAAQSGPVVNDLWTFHHEGCEFVSCGIGFSGWAVYWRTFNNFWRDQQPIDIIGIRRSANANVDVSDEVCQIWYRGNVMADTQDYFIEDHADYFQFGGGSGAYQVGGMNILCHENMMYSDGSTQRGWQGTPFGHDVSGISQFVDFDNITVITGNHGAVMYDQSGEGDMFVENNMFIRSGVLKSGGNAWVRFSSETGSIPGQNGGDINVRRNYTKGIQGATTSSWGPAQVPGLDQSNNILCDGPTQYNTLFKGSFSSGWTLENKTSTNRQSVRNAFRARFEPVDGWNPSVCGPSDPQTWLHWGT